MESNSTPNKLVGALFAMVEALNMQMEETETEHDKLNHLISLMREHGSAPAAVVLETWEAYHES